MTDRRDNEESRHEGRNRLQRLLARWAKRLANQIPRRPHVVVPVTPPVIPPVVPQVGNFLYSEPDYVSRNDRNHPATRKCYDDIHISMDGHWGEYVIAILRLLNPGLNKREFEHGLKGLFNGGRAFDNGKSYESGDWGLENLFCAGATLRAFNYEIVMKSGSRFAKVHAIDPRINLPIPRRLEDVDMTLHFYATTATATGNNPFPQFDGRVIIPFFGRDGYNLVRLDRYESRGGLRRVSTIQHPFLPQRADITKLGL